MKAAQLYSGALRLSVTVECDEPTDSKKKWQFMLKNKYGVLILRTPIVGQAHAM